MQTPTAEPAALRTRVASCMGLSFRPINSNTRHNTTSAGGGRSIIWHPVGADGYSFDGYFLCDPGLPHRAVVTKVQFTVRDVADDAEVRYCALIRTGLTELGATQEPTVMAQVASTGFSAKPGVVRKSTTTITAAMVDNVRYAYALQCQINWVGGNTNRDSTEQAGIFGASLTYQIDSLHG